MAADQSKKPVERTTRTAILAAVGVVLILLVALFIAALVAPNVHTHVVLRGIDRMRPSVPLGDVRYRAAVKRLGGSKHAAKRLLFYMRLPRWIAPLRESAFVLLSECGESGVPALSAMMESEVAKERLYAVQALGLIGPEAEDAVELLALALCDPDAEVRMWAAHGLGEIGPPAAKKALPALERALKDENARVRAFTAEALGKIGPCTVPLLITALGDSDSGVRARAILTLEALGPSARAAVPHLERLISQEKENDFRDAAARVIEKIRGPGGAPAPAAGGE